MKEQLQSCIDIVTYLNNLYRKAASLSSMYDIRETLLNFAKEEAQAQTNLKRFYYELYQEYYDTPFAEIVIQGSFRDVLKHIYKIEQEAYLKIRQQTYMESHYLLQEMMRSIADMKLHHQIIILIMMMNIAKE